ncbi:hypothetical protein M758_11G150300 [Ceratodon purpureus]|nr:hypothetical protein M758_11G150300 [Ceratodon purpureus]
MLGWVDKIADYCMCCTHVQNLSHPLLEKSLQALSPLRLRLGGTVQDQIVYDVGLSPEQPCLPLVKDDSFISDYRGGCLSMERWVALNNLFAKTGVLVAFGLNALFNRSRLDSGEWGPWDSSNAHDFIKYTVEQGIAVEAWELGNELTLNRVVTTIPAKQYGQDMRQLRSVVDSLYKDTMQRPLVVAPDGTGNVAGNEIGFYITLLNESGPGVVDVVTRHIYNLGPGNSEDLVERILNASVLDNDLDNFRTVQRIIQTTAPWAVAWIGEAGGAYNSGKNLVSNAFVNSFWYLDQLAMSATFNTKAYCRQTLIGGNYGLLNSTTFRPNPDLYSAILWKRLMGTVVLATTVEAKYSQVRAYTHCQSGTTSGGVTMLLINLSNSTVSVNVNLKSPISTESRKRTKLIPHKSKEGRASTRYEYHLSASNGDLHSQTSLLNGVPLELTPSGDLPSVDIPLVKENTAAVSVKALSIVFVVLPDAEVPVCMVQPR